MSLLTYLTSDQFDKIKKDLWDTIIIEPDDKYVRTYTICAFDPILSSVSGPALSWTNPDFIDGGILIPRKTLFMYLNKRGVNRLSISVDISNKMIYDVPNTITSNITLYENQQEYLNKIQQSLTSSKRTTGTGSAMLQLGCGYGKTFIAIAALTTGVLNLPCLIVAPTLVIQTQWLDIINTNTSLRAKCHSGGADKLYVETLMHDVVIVTTHIFSSPTNVDKAKKVGNTFASVIYDELHMMLGPQARRMFAFINASDHLGLTATPDLNDVSRLFINAMFCDPITSNINRSDQFTVYVNNIVLNAPTEYSGSLRFTKPSDTKPGDISTEITGALVDPRRIDIIDYVWPFVKLQPTIVFVSSVQDAYKIAHRINKLGCTEIGVLTGQTPASSRSHITKNSRVIVATFQAACTGFSEDRFRNMIIYSHNTSKSDMLKQTIGRIMRIDDGIIRHVFDIADEGSRTEFRQMLVRRNYYHVNKTFYTHKFSMEYEGGKWIRQ